MRTITLAYPGFHTLPRAVKKLLVVSESFFFCENDMSKTAQPPAVQIPVRILQTKNVPANEVFENSDWNN